MKNNSELIFSDSLKELPNRVKQLDNKVVDIQKELDNMLLFNSIDELSLLIKNKLFNKLEQLNKKINDTNIWINNYVDDVDILSRGLEHNSFSKISEFNEAQVIINGDFK